MGHRSTRTQKFIMIMIRPQSVGCNTLAKFKLSKTSKVQPAYIFEIISVSHPAFIKRVCINLKKGTSLNGHNGLGASHQPPIVAARQIYLCILLMHRKFTACMRF